MSTTTTAAPPVPQHMAALGRANQIRLGRARLKASVAAGTPQEGLAAVRRLLEQDPEVLSSLACGELLQWPRRWGRSRALAVLARAGVSEARPVGMLTDRQRRALIDALER